MHGKVTQNEFEISDEDQITWEDDSDHSLARGQI